MGQVEELRGTLKKYSTAQRSTAQHSLLAAVSASGEAI